MIFVTAGTVNEIFDLIKSDSIYQDVLMKYFPSKDIRDEFHNELWLYLLEHPEKTIDVWNKRYFKYYYISIIKRQVLSNSSDWHVKFRATKFELMEELPDQTAEEINPFEEEEYYHELKSKSLKLEIIEKALNHFQKRDKHFKPSADMFRMHYYEGLSIRQISKRFFNTPATTCWEHIKNAEILIKHYISKYHPNIKL